jgi:hypothetical protein
MSNSTFGITLLLVGMGGTLFALWLLTLIIRVLVKLLPPPPLRPEPPKKPTPSP